MERLRWALLAVTALAVGACAAATVDPALEAVGSLAPAAMGLTAGLVLWAAGRARSPRWRGWRLLAAAPLFPVLGTALAAVARPAGALPQVVLQWVPTVPGYLLAIAGLLTLVDRTRLRTGRRAAVELALFVLACLVVLELLIIGPDGRWSALRIDERLILVAAVAATSLTLAATLVLLGAVEAHRQRMALVLLAGAVLLTAGRGLSTAAQLAGAGAAVHVSRVLVVGGLALLALAVLVDPGPRAADRTGPRGGRSTGLGQVLAHVAMLAAAATVATVFLLGRRPSTAGVVGAVLCVALAAVHRVVTARDEQLLTARLRRSEAYFRSLVACSGDAVVILDGELRISWASPALHQVLGAAAAELPGRRLLDAVHPDDVAELAAAVRPAADGAAPDAPGTGLLLVRLADAEGVWRCLEASVSDLRGDSDVGAVVLHCRDVTERRAREEALRSVAYTDPMTGLPNRAGFLRAVQRTLGGDADAGAWLGTGLLLIELEGLGEAREHTGRDMVTSVVAEVGQRLRATVRIDDVVARMGGGAFAILARSTATEADQLAHRCLAVVEQPIATSAGIVDLTASVGVVVVEPGLTVEDLLGRAELAVRAARTAGAGSAIRYAPALGEAAARRERLRTDLHGARARGELFLLFSPIVSLEEQRVTGVEAELRWRHPELGDVPPGEFLPIAERAGLIGELQRWALEEAATAVRTLPASGAPLRLGVDAPAAYVAGGTMVADVEAALQRSGLAPERLVLEIPEAAVLADDARVALDVATVRLMGAHVALDHFGAGYSSLAHLTRLPIDILKLDRSLLARVDRDPHDRALCESIVGIGRALGVDIVAEGVETSAQLATLCSFSCGFAQGFLISRPLPLGELRALLEDHAGVLWPGLVGQR